ncbi:hypothetical protein PGT21_019255 [Puccinia graminis f. sp. tritici]|uniref:Uncharacterized protein n=1 Tax=Puccinia graminis f. sp. tritici TaxID=56615 RepID=A0A5B0NL43_PUCGR|nr:hypothetical protein PGT21_019255 [Puccinia graminis f. sp. tritici]
MKTVCHKLLYALFIPSFLKSVIAGCQNHRDKPWHFSRSITESDGNTYYIYQCGGCTYEIKRARRL